MHVINRAFTVLAVALLTPKASSEGQFHFISFLLYCFSPPEKHKEKCRPPHSIGNHKHSLPRMGGNRQDSLVKPVAQG